MARWSQLPAEIVEVLELRLPDPLPAARAALLGEPANVQRAAMISLVERHNDHVRTPFQDIDPLCRGLAFDDLGKPGDPWLLSGGLLDALPALGGWSLAELRRLLRPIGNPYAIYDKAVPAIRAVIRQIDGLDAGLLTQLEFELTAFAGALSRPNVPIDAGFAAEVTRLLPPRTALDGALALIEAVDDWGVKCLLALRHQALHPDSTAAVIAVAKLAGGSGRPDRWRTRLQAVLDSGDAEIVGTTGVVLDALTGVISTITWRGGWLPFIPWAGNERLAAGAVAAYGWWIARAAGPAERAEAGERCDRLAWWGARWDSNRPVSGPIAREAAGALGEIGGDAAVVALHRLRERFGTRPGLGKHLDAALQQVLEGSDRSLVQILTSSGPWFGLDRSGRRQWTTDRGAVRLDLDPPHALITELTPTSADTQPTHTQAADAVHTHTQPADAVHTGGSSGAVALAHADALAEAQEIRRAAESELVVLIRRFETALRDRATFTREEFTEIALEHPVSAAVARQLIWEFHGAGSTQAGVPSGDGAIETLTGAVTPADYSAAGLWHPLTAGGQDVRRWAAWAARRSLHQPFQQIERETFSLAGFPPCAGLVPFRQLEGILRARGWRVHRLDRWDGGDQGPAERIEPSSGFRCAVQLTADMTTPDGPLRCHVGPPDIDLGRLEPGDPRVPVLVSEALRDLALVASKARPTTVD